MLGQQAPGLPRQDGNTYFEHQDWEGTGRMRTDSAGAVAATYVSLRFGDGYSANVIKPIADQDNYKYASLDQDTESATGHAQFRQYSPALGRLLSPDSYSGSYDFTNPQSFTATPMR